MNAERWSKEQKKVFIFRVGLIVMGTIMVTLRWIYKI